MSKVRIITSVVVIGIFGVAACGGGSSDKDNSTVTTVRQKNAALLFPNLPATTAPKTITTPLPAIGGGIRPTTTVANATTTSVVKTPNIYESGATTIVPATTTTPLPGVTTVPFISSKPKSPVLPK